MRKSCKRGRREGGKERERESKGESVNVGIRVRNGRE